MRSAALDSADVLLSYSITSLACNHYTDLPSFKHINIYIYLQLAFYVLKLFVSVVSCFPCCELGSNSLFTKGPLLTRRKTQALLVWSAVGAVAAGCFGFVMLNTYMEGHV